MLNIDLPTAVIRSAKLPLIIGQYGRRYRSH